MCSFYGVLFLYKNIFIIPPGSESAKSNLGMCLFWKNSLITDVIYKVKTDRVKNIFF